MAKTIRVKISADGKKVKHIYNDALLPVDIALGDVKVQRATSVEFCGDENVWQATDLETGEVLPMQSRSRQEVLDYEHTHLNEKLCQEVL